MRNHHIIYGEDTRAMQELAAELRTEDSSIEIQLRNARTFADTDEVGVVHIIGDFPHIAEAYKAREFFDGTEYFTPKVLVDGAEYEGLKNQPTGPVNEDALKPVETKGEKGVPGVETPAALAERGEESVAPEPTDNPKPRKKKA